jgi:serine/threonine protein phosphatase 1
MPSFATRIQGPVAVIGDVHGQIEKLDAILEQLRRLPDFERRWIVFIGDLVDRGTDPKGVIDRMLSLQREHPSTTAVIGNHELAMAGALGLIPAPEYSDWANQWVQQYGVESTFTSYGAELGDLATLKENLPAEHADFIAQGPWVVEHPQAIFVHAGLDPNQPLELQLRILRQRDFSLNRPPWLCSKTFAENGVPPDCLALVVSGHVPVPEVIYRPHRRLLIDTTGGRGGDLSCVLLPELLVLTSAGKPLHPLVEPEPDRPWWKFW